MRLTVRRAGATAAAALLVALSTGVNAAIADDAPTGADAVVNAEPPQETDPADTGLTDVPADQVDVEPDIPGSGDTGAGNQPGSEICDRGNVYIPTSKGKDYHSRVGAPQANTNRTSHSITSDFTAQVSGTVGVKVSYGLMTSIGTMIRQLNEKFGVSLSASLTATLGNKVHTTTSPNMITHAEYGVYRLRSQGKSYTIYSNCQTSPKTTVTSYSPDWVGWYVWETRV